jgi:hypothetical protein
VQGNLGGATGVPNNLGSFPGGQNNLGGATGVPNNCGGMPGNSGNVAGVQGNLGGNFGMQPGGGQVFVYSCSKCRAQVNRTDTRCPSCGAVFVNSIGGGWDNRPNANQPPAQNPTPSSPFSGDVNHVITDWDKPSSKKDQAANKDGEKSDSNLGVIIAAGAGGFLLLVAIVVTLICVCTAQPARKKRKRRLRPVPDDDDY